MDKKKIKESLDKYIDMFYNIVDDKLADEIKGKFFIAGGAIYSIHNNQEPKDIDIFLTDEKIKRKVLSHFHLNSSLKYKKGVKVGTYLDGDERVVITDNAISIGIFQIITQWCGEPKHVVGQFDFLHNMFYYFNNELETLSQWSYLDDNVLRYNRDRARDICGTIIRVNRFVERGFTITNREMSKMLLKLNEVGFNDRELEILESFDEQRNNFGS